MSTGKSENLTPPKLSRLQQLKVICNPPPSLPEEIFDTPEYEEQLKAYIDKYAIFNQHLAEVSTALENSLMKKLLIMDAKEGHGTTKLVALYALTKPVKKPKNLFITISPPDKYTIEYLIEKTAKTVKKAWIASGSYTFEQRGEIPTQLGKGKHIHLFARVEDSTKTEHKRMIKEIANTYNIDKSFIKIDYITEGTEQRVLDYMHGIKSDPDKQKKVAMDKLFRAKHSLNPFYQFVN